MATGHVKDNLDQVVLPNLKTASFEPEEIITGPGPSTVFGPHVKGWIFDPHAPGSWYSPPGLQFQAFGTLQYGVHVGAGNILRLRRRGPHRHRGGDLRTSYGAIVATGPFGY